MIQATVLNGPHKDTVLDLCPHTLYHDLKTDEGQLAEYKLNKIYGTYFLVYQRIRCELQQPS